MSLHERQDWYDIYLDVLFLYFILQEGKLSFEEAILARQNLIKQNKQKVQEIKQEVGTNFDVISEYDIKTFWESNFRTFWSKLKSFNKS